MPQAASAENSQRSALTVIASVNNERVNAEAWLDHLQWADRILVVDTGSRDGSQQFFRDRGVEVLEFTPPGGLLHAAKNHALKQVSSGWVLDLDLDERLTLELQHEIRSSIADTPLAAFRLPFTHYVFGRYLKYGGWRTQHLRLYRAGAVRYPEDRAHSTPKVNGEIGDLKHRVVHFAQPILHDFVTKMNRYTSQDAPLIATHGRGGLRNREPLAAKPWRWIFASLSVFWNRYFKAAGFRDGVPGFLIACLMSVYVFVEQAKVWEHRKRASEGKVGA